MDYFSIEKNNINVVYDSSLIDEAYGITPEMGQILQELYPKVQRGKQSTIKKLKKYCRRYPHIPHFKNYLEAAYQQAGKTQKAVEMNRITVEEHPDYLFGKINYANILLEEGEVGKVPDILGKELDLKALYPSRDAFHLREILGFYQVCVRYYLAVDNYDKAEDCMALMNEVGPDEPETEEASFRWTSAMMEGVARRMEEENKRRRSVESRSYDDSVQTTEKPVFNHSEIEGLYANDMRIDHGIVRKILQLPRESLIEDLETVVEDSIRRFEYFRELDGQNEEWQTEKFSFNMHALFLLAELEAEESLPQVLRLLRQGQEFLDFWFADMLDQIGREVIFKVGQHKLSELQAFMKEPDNDCYARNTTPAALTQLALHKKDRRAEVVEWFDELFHFFLENTEDNRIIDTDLISFMVWDCIDLGAAELEEQIQNLYDHTLVEPGIAGTVEDALRDMKSAQYSSRKYKIDDIFSRYDYLADLWYPDANQSIFDTYLQNNKGTQLFGQQEPFVSEKEVGRNDPCPCGSGKKYKYCCMR